MRRRKEHQRDKTTWQRYHGSVVTLSRGNHGSAIDEKRHNFPVAECEALTNAVESVVTVGLVAGRCRLEKDLGDEIAWKHDNETDDCGGTKWKITTLETMTARSGTKKRDVVETSRSLELTEAQDGERTPPWRTMLRWLS